MGAGNGRGFCLALAAIALAALAACRAAPKTPEPPPSPTPTATPLPAPSRTPTVRGMPVETTPRDSIYDRTPGVLHEEKGTPRTPNVPKSPTPRPENRADHTKGADNEAAGGRARSGP